MEQDKGNVAPPRAERPRVSLITTVYNEAPFLADSVRSVLAQSERSIELIIVDDASTDGSLAIARKFAAADQCIRLIENARNVGLTASRRTALAAARGKYVGFVDADDFISPDAVCSALRAMEDSGADTALLSLQMYYSPTDIRPYCAPIAGTMSGREAFIRCIEGRIHSVCIEERSHYAAVPLDCSLRLYSDDNTARMHLYISRRVCACGGKYFYRRHAASETHAISIRRFDYLLAGIGLKEQLRRAGGDRGAMRVLEIHRWKNIAAHYKLLRECGASFSHFDRLRALCIIRKSLAATDFRLLPLRLMLRPPYWPTHSLRTYLAYQQLYFAARRAFRALRGTQRS